MSYDRDRVKQERDEINTLLVSLEGYQGLINILPEGIDRYVLEEFVRHGQEFRVYLTDKKIDELFP